MQIAVIADPHFHDIRRHPAGPAYGPWAFRTFADTVASTRVFNESDAALRATLDDVVRRGIRFVVLVGDLTDDGQLATVRNVMAVLDDYAARHGLRFFSTPGNHDLFAVHGRHQGKRFLNPDGTHVLVTSDPAAVIGESSGLVVTPEMYCAGYAEGLAPLAGLGYFRSGQDLHWESPFGTSDRLDERTFPIRSADGATLRTMIDASYLVEPVAGLWLLSLDANVFEPRDGASDPVPEASYIDSTDAGWNAMLRHKRFVLDWAASVTSRAAAGGKQLLVFSHYPMIDPLAGTLEDERLVFGETAFARRAPRPAVAEAAIAAGIRVHFSGHLHVNSTGRVRAGEGGGFLVNVGVPSLVGFPPAYKIAEFRPGRLAVSTVVMDDVAGFDAAFGYYRREAARAGRGADDLAGATDHARFLSGHLAHLVRTRYLPLEWPPDLAALVPVLTLGDLVDLAGEGTSLDGAGVLEWRRRRPPAAASGWQAIPFFELVVDGYRLRQARQLAAPFVPADRLEAYLAAGARFAAGRWQPGSVQARLAAFLRMLAVYAAGLPAGDFEIDLASGGIEAVAEDQRGRTERRHTGSA